MTLAEIGQDIKKRQHLREMEAQAFSMITDVGWSLCYLQLKQQVPLAQERRIPFVDRIHKWVCETQLTNHGCLSSVNLSAGRMVQAPFRLKKIIKTASSCSFHGQMLFRDWVLKNVPGVGL